MTSHEITTEGNGVRRKWMIQHIKTKTDASMIMVGDIIQSEPNITLLVTHIGHDLKDANFPVFVGNVFGARHQGLRDGEVIAWGRKGIARNYSHYMEGNYYNYTTKKGYLWV
jgi:hypothetical protein